MELESWEASAHLQLQQSKDSKNTGILLVEEYGSLLARAGIYLYFNYFKIIISQLCEYN